MQHNQSLDERFGHQVYVGRRSYGWSQRDLVKRLSEEGLNLDTSAISRIEKGTRSLRLEEAATVARVLGFSIGEIEVQRDPVTSFKYQRLALNNALSTAESGVLDLAGGVLGVMLFLDQDPSVLASLENEEGEAPPTDAASYIRWVSRRWATNSRPEGTTQILRADVANATRDLLATMAATIILDGDDE